jgi:glycolate oxidase FAD binding subunit
MAVRVEGTEEEVAAQGDLVCAAVGRDPSEAVEDWVSPAHVDAPGGVTLKITAAPSDLVGVVRATLARLRETAARLAHVPLRIAGHLGAGIARFHLAAATAEDPLPDAPAAFADFTAFAALWSATEPGAAIRTRLIERAPAAIKAAHDVWGAPPASLSLMRALKRRFDPDDVLAPGRFVGGL